MNQTNGKNQYRCHFCQKMCKVSDRAGKYGKYARWQHCSKCKDVFFAVGPAARLKAVHFHVPNPKQEDSYYTLEIDYKANETRIDYWSPPTQNLTFTGSLLNLTGGSYTVRGANKSFTFGVSAGKIVWDPQPDRILTLNKPLKDINPKNVYEKIKMYILFS
jgi:hypothetical protein